nr:MULTISPECIES: ABC-three component system protein [unclassified Caballeronia]
MKDYFNYCEEKLTWMCVRIETLGKLNLLNLNLHAEDFYIEFFNVLFGYALVNTNATSQNAEAIDLIDSGEKLVVQVSATATKVKIESALGKNLSVYKGHKFQFISIAKDASHLRKLTYVNPHSLVFYPKQDIHDLASILSHLLHLTTAQQHDVFEFIKKQLGSDTDQARVESNLAEIIKILAQEDLSATGSSVPSTGFSVDDKINFNNLATAASVVQDYAVYHPRMNGIYAEFDRAGKNRSISVMQALKSEYLRLRKDYKDDDLFFRIIDASMDRVIESPRRQNSCRVI